MKTAPADGILTRIIEGRKHRFQIRAGASYDETSATYESTGPLPEAAPAGEPDPIVSSLSLLSAEAKARVLAVLNAEVQNVGKPSAGGNPDGAPIGSTDDAPAGDPANAATASDGAPVLNTAAAAIDPAKSTKRGGSSNTAGTGPSETTETAAPPPVTSPAAPEA